MVLIFYLPLKELSMLGYAPASSGSQTDGIALTMQARIVTGYHQISDRFLLLPAKRGLIVASNLAK